MQNWAKRGFQTALVTGGLLMLGTGIASANENVDPDRPVSPIDGSITVPVDISNNAFGAPDGPHDAPEFQETISTRDVTDPIKEEFEASLPEDDPFQGNRINADLVVPVQITNNAGALLGDAEVEGGDSSQSYDGSNDIETDGSGEVLGGNVIDLDWALPVQIANNAGALFGNAKTTDNNAEQDTKQGGGVTTDGSDGVLSGNVLAGHGATPLQGNNNAAAVGGTAESEDNSSSSTTETGGAIITDGTDGVLSGNAGAGPLAAAGGFNNNAASWVGKADSHGADNTVDATAGGSKTGINDIPSYVQTKGDGGVGSGNIAQPQGAGNGTAHGNAGTWIGTATTGGGVSDNDGANTHETNTKSGGFSSTSGTDSVGSGNMADAPVALPVEAFCVAGSWIGIAEANCESSTTADAGWGTFTDGSGSVVGGNSAHVPIAGTAEAFGIGGTWIGTADAAATEDKTVNAGGYNGTRGDDSTIGGNLVQAPVAAPVETFGIGGAWGGSGSGTASETKTVSAGGDNSTIDDNGNGSSNIIATPIAAPVQAFGIGGAWIGEGHGEATADTETNAGGYSKASGPGGVLSGNIVQGAASSPVQAFGIGGVWGGTASGAAENTSSSTAGDFTQTDGTDGTGSGNIVAAAYSVPAQAHSLGASWIGNADGVAVNTTDSAAGGDSTTDGTGSSLGGNVVQAPIGGAATLFGSAASWVGSATGFGTNDVISQAGGDVNTAGDEGSISGNVLSAQALPIAQAFGNAGSLTAIAAANGTNTTDATSGGDITTSGEAGSLSGNIFDVPAAAVAQIFGNALTIGGIAEAVGINDTTGTVGGLAVSSGDNDSGSGYVTQIPLGSVVQIFGFEGPILGEAVAVAANVTSVTVANDLAQIDIPIDGSEMAIDGLPSFPSADSFAAPRELDMVQAPAERSGTQQLSPALQPKPFAAPAAPAGMPAMPGLGELPQGLDSLPQGGFAMPMPAPAAPAAPAMPEGGLAMPMPAPAAPAAADNLSPQVQPGQVNAGQTGFRGMFAKFAGLLTGKPYSIQG
ncbi:MAG: beta strand repeat-containing protein [Haloechinothrix sp.]